MGRTGESVAAEPAKLIDDHYFRAVDRHGGQGRLSPRAVQRGKKFAASFLGIEVRNLAAEL